MVIVLDVDEQVPAEVMFHCNTFVPRPKPLTVVVAELELVNTAVPDTTLHVPVPVVGVLAASVVLLVVIHNVCDGPALAKLVAGSTWMVIVLEVDEHVPTEVIFHCNTFIPKPRFVIVEFGDNELVIVPLPLITLHVPIPVVGVLAASVVELVVIHNV